MMIWRILKCLKMTTCKRFITVEFDSLETRCYSIEGDGLGQWVDLMSRFHRVLLELGPFFWFVVCFGRYALQHVEAIPSQRPVGF